MVFKMAAKKNEYRVNKTGTTCYVMHETFKIIEYLFKQIVILMCVYIAYNIIWIHINQDGVQNGRQNKFK